MYLLFCFYGRKVSSGDITNQKEDAIVMKLVSYSGDQKTVLTPKEDFFFSALSRLNRGK